MAIFLWKKLGYILDFPADDAADCQRLHLKNGREPKLAKHVISSGWWFQTLVKYGVMMVNPG